MQDVLRYQQQDCTVAIKSLERILHSFNYGGHVSVSLLFCVLWWKSGIARGA